jgi:hypothetical protein
MINLLAEGQILDAGEDRGQLESLTMCRGDKDAIQPDPSRPSHLSKWGIKYRSHQWVSCMRTKAAFSQHFSDLVCDRPRS